MPGRKNQDPEPEVVIEDQVPEDDHEPIAEAAPEPAPTRAHAHERPAFDFDQIGAGIGRGIAAGLRDLGLGEQKDEPKSGQKQEIADDRGSDRGDLPGDTPGKPTGEPRAKRGFVDWFFGS